MTMFFPKKLAQELKLEYSRLQKDLTKAESVSLDKTLLNHELPHILSQISKDDVEIIHMIKKLYHYGGMTQSQKKKTVAQLNELNEFLRKAKLPLSKDQTYQLNTMVAELSQLLKHEIEFLGYTPGADRKEYVRLADILMSPQKKLVVDKEELSVQGNNIFYGGRQIQGCKFISNEFGNQVVEMSAEHYTSQEGVENLYHHGYLEAASKLFAGHEKYCYVVEPGVLQGKTEKELKRILGAKHASACITVKLRIPAHHVWIRVKRGYPAKFALEAQRVPFSAPKPQKGFRVVLDGVQEYWAA